MEQFAFEHHFEWYALNHDLIIFYIWVINTTIKGAMKYIYFKQHFATTLDVWPKHDFNLPKHYLGTLGCACTPPPETLIWFFVFVLVKWFTFACRSTTPQNCYMIQYILCKRLKDVHNLFVMKITQNTGHWVDLACLQMLLGLTHYVSNTYCMS